MFYILGSGSGLVLAKNNYAVYDTDDKSVESVAGVIVMDSISKGFEFGNVVRKNGGYFISAFPVPSKIVYRDFLLVLEKEVLYYKYGCMNMAFKYTGKYTGVYMERDSGIIFKDSGYNSIKLLGDASYGCMLGENLINISDGELYDCIGKIW